jgi:hypothetical protein
MTKPLSPDSKPRADTEAATDVATIADSYLQIELIGELRAEVAEAYLSFDAIVQRLGRYKTRAR